MVKTRYVLDLLDFDVSNSHHYTKIIVVRSSVRTDGSSPAQKGLFLCKAEVWRCNSWLTDTASNGTSSRLNFGFQKRAGQNGDRQTYSLVAA